MFIKNLTSGVIEQITFDGEKNNIINGTTDWVYEEEFSITKGYNWSFDSKHIAFLKFNESKNIICLKILVILNLQKNY